jgi:hypothetical protein
VATANTAMRPALGMHTSLVLAMTARPRGPMLYRRMRQVGAIMPMCEHSAIGPPISPVRYWPIAFILLCIIALHSQYAIKIERAKLPYANQEFRYAVSPQGQSEPG